MKRWIIFISILVLLVVAGVLIYELYFRRLREENVILLYGNVDVRQVDMGFRVSGRVIDMFFEEGDYVPKDTLMAVLDNQPYLDEVKEAEAAIQSIQARLENAEQLFQRRAALIGDGSVSKEDLDNAQATRDALAANLQQAQATLGVRETNLRDTKFYAPTDGTILTRIREPGSVVRVGDPVYTLSIISPVWVRAFIPEKDLGVVYPGMPAQIFTDTPHGKVYTGQVGFISPVAEFTPKTVESTELRTDLVYRLRIYADNPDRGLRQGMPVTVKLELPSKDKEPKLEESERGELLPPDKLQKNNEALCQHLDE
jgi:HlyD family secretion protein